MVKMQLTGYRFRIFDGMTAYDVMTKSDMSVEECQQKIDGFFDNFTIQKSSLVTPDMKLESKCRERREELKSEPNKEQEKVVKMARPKAEPITKKWGVVKSLLKDEFTIAEYLQALRDAGYEYTPMSWDTIFTGQLRGLKKLGKVKEIPDSKPKRYRKVLSEPQELKPDAQKDGLVKKLKEEKKLEIFV